MMRTVYFAGPIAGCTKGEANDWRDEFARRLADIGVRGVSPLRCEPLIGERYMLNYVDPRFGTPRAIASKNAYDVRSCDLTLAYLPREIIERRPSHGTIIELAWAHILGKPTILVTDDPYLQEHPVVQACAGWNLDNFEDAYDVIVGVLGTGRVA